MVLGEDYFGNPKIVTDKEIIKEVLVCHYGLTSDNSTFYLNQSINYFEEFKNSTIDEYFSWDCKKTLGLHKNWCNDRDSCRLVCFQKESCQYLMLSIRWPFVDAMVDYANQTLELQNKINATYSFDSMGSYKEYVDAMAYIHHSRQNLQKNPIIGTWPFCTMPGYNWTSAKNAYLTALKAYYVEYPTESLEDMAKNVKSNSENRILMFRTRNYMIRKNQTLFANLTADHY